jgi:ABC-2 type transport system permease protein
MTRLIRAEAAKLRSVRSYRLLALGAFIVIVGGTAATTATTSYTAGVNPARTTLALACLAQTFALIAGALAITGEFRHKTIVPAALITPRRVPLVAAKAVTLAVAGLAFGAVATGAAEAIALPVLAARHVPSQVDGAQLAAIVAGGAVATALAALVGLALGTVIRNQVGAIIAILAVLYVAEPLLGFIPHVGTAVQRYGLGGLVSGATGTSGFPVGSHLLGQVPAALVIAGYALAVLVPGVVLLRTRDIAG